jgi:hypothetical protein
MKGLIVHLEESEVAAIMDRTNDILAVLTLERGESRLQKSTTAMHQYGESGKTLSLRDMEPYPDSANAKAGDLP